MDSINDYIRIKTLSVKKGRCLTAIPSLMFDDAGIHSLMVLLGCLSDKMVDDAVYW